MSTMFRKEDLVGAPYWPGSPCHSRNQPVNSRSTNAPAWTQQPRLFPWAIFATWLTQTPCRCPNFPFSFALLGIVPTAVLALALKPLLHRAEEEKPEVGFVCLFQTYVWNPWKTVVINLSVLLAVTGGPILAGETLRQDSNVYNS